MIGKLEIGERLKVAPLVDPQGLTFRIARKTKEIKAKPIGDILSDPIGYNKFLLDTLEGTQALKEGSMLCVGFNDDCWQQSPKNLFAKYEPVNTTAQGWVIYRPKPDNQVSAGEVPTHLVSSHGYFSIIGTYGDQIPVSELDSELYAVQLGRYASGDSVFLQTGVVGDMVLHRPGDFSDNWRVARSFFDATYAFEDD